jgi:hypothetical protein
MNTAIPESMRALSNRPSGPQRDQTRLGDVLVLLAACATLALPRTAFADDPRERPMAVGFNIDLLPTALSAANGKLGYAPQVWLGIGQARLRIVGAHLEPPDAFAFAPQGFHDPTTTAFATIIDYTFGPRFDGTTSPSHCRAKSP